MKAVTLGWEREREGETGESRRETLKVVVGNPTRWLGLFQLLIFIA